MNYVVLIVVCFVVASIAWAFLSKRRYAPNLESLLGQLKSPSEAAIGPNPCQALEEQRHKDDQLWDAISGTQGLYRMWHNAGILLTLATRMNEECGPNRTEAHDHNSDLALMLRWASFIGMLEGSLIAIFPRLPVPRFVARFAFDQYCELCASVRAMIEFHHPTLVEQFDRVI